MISPVMRNPAAKDRRSLSSILRSLVSGTSRRDVALFVDVCETAILNLVLFFPQSFHVRVLVTCLAKTGPVDA